ncbi:sigma factor-like helix-turn-helix DNA-binding protein [Sphingobacteruim zhuxiongii]|uniref:sigma factor-like helix-turn-helix DNA-binding protein n=1 Tax=Sphingobacterium zhuxiongii TaxID=2662364 RepID=UPI00351CF722
MRAVNSLSEKEYEIFAMHLEGFKQYEISEHLHITKQEVSTILALSKKKLSFNSI